MLAELRDRMDRLLAGADPRVHLVTACDGEELAGCLVTFATQCSIRPLRYLVCLAAPNRTARVARRAGTLAVHVAGAAQLDLAARLGGTSGDDVDTFAELAWRPWQDGTPILTDCPGWFVGAVVHRTAVGDHDAYVLDPIDVGVEDEPGAALRSRDVRHIRPGRPL